MTEKLAELFEEDNGVAATPAPRRPVPRRLHS